MFSVVTLILIGKDPDNHCDVPWVRSFLRSDLVGKGLPEPILTRSRKGGKKSAASNGCGTNRVVSRKT